MNTPNNYLLYSCALSTVDPINYNGKLWCTNKATRDAVTRSGITHDFEQIESIMQAFFSLSLNRQNPPDKVLPVRLAISDGTKANALFSYSKATPLPTTYMFEVENNGLHSVMAYLRAQTPLADKYMGMFDRLGLQQMAQRKWDRHKGSHESNQPSISNPGLTTLSDLPNLHLPVDYWFNSHPQIALSERQG